MNDAEALRTVAALATLPRGTTALLDWCSGIARIDATMDEFAALRARLNNEEPVPVADAPLLEAVSHEAIHYLQICTMGFLYQFAVELLHAIIAVVPKNLEDGHAFVSLDPSELQAQLEPHARALIERIDLPAAGGVTVRALAESHAYYAQKLHHWKNFEPDAMLAILADAPGDDYRMAFLIAYDRLGHDAFATFPLLAALALCTTAPQIAFTNLCDAAARERLIVGTEPFDFPVLAQALAAHAGCGFYGTADVVARSWEKKHVVYSPTIQRLSELDQSAFSIPRFFVHPGAISVELSAVATPILFLNVSTSGDLPLVVPAGFWANDMVEGFTPNAQQMCLLWLIGSRILRSHG
jgi:hypothetical protein